jgi:hypothetical protein
MMRVRVTAWALDRKCTIIQSTVCSLSQKICHRQCQVEALNHLDVLLFLV